MGTTSRRIPETRSTYSLPIVNNSTTGRQQSRDEIRIFTTVSEMGTTGRRQSRKEI